MEKGELCQPLVIERCEAFEVGGEREVRPRYGMVLLSGYGRVGLGESKEEVDAIQLTVVIAVQ